MQIGLFIVVCVYVSPVPSSLSQLCDFTLLSWEKCLPSISLKSLYGKVIRILYVQPNMKLSSADPRAFERFVLFSYLENERVCVHVCMNVFFCLYVCMRECL